jgi:hypothetical protein
MGLYSTSQFLGAFVGGIFRLDKTEFDW